MPPPSRPRRRCPRQRPPVLHREGRERRSALIFSSCPSSRSEFDTCRLRRAFSTPVLLEIAPPNVKGRKNGPLLGSDVGSGEPTVDHEGRTVDVRRLVRGQEQCGI